MLHLFRTNSDHPDFLKLVVELDRDLWSRYPEIQSQYTGFNKVENIATVVVAYWNEDPAGCGCFKAGDASTIEIKRMFVQTQYRGKGIGLTIVNELLHWAKTLDYKNAILELGDNQPEAIKVYKKAGFQIIPNYEPYIGMEHSICMGRKL